MVSLSDHQDVFHSERPPYKEKNTCIHDIYISKKIGDHSRG